MSLSPEDRIRVAEESLSRQLQWVRAVEAKVSVLAAVAMGMLGLLATRIPTDFESWKAVALFAIIGAAGQIACLTSCGLATFPRLKHKNLSLLFFATIASLTEDECVTQFKSVDSDAYLNDLLKQVHRNAQIATAKYWHVRFGTVSLLVSVPLWLGAVYGLGAV